MPALPYPKYTLDKLYIYPYFPTRQAYTKATGRSCPPWDPTRRPKRWYAPEAANSQEDFVVFPHVLATDPKEAGRGALAGPDGKPYLKQLLLPKDIAASINIPESTANVPGADQPEYPAPCRALEANEELFFDPTGLGAVMVKNTDLYSLDSGTFTAQDRALLRAIAQKLGV